MKKLGRNEMKKVMGGNIPYLNCPGNPQCHFDYQCTDPAPTPPPGCDFVKWVCSYCDDPNGGVLRQCIAVFLC